MVIGLRLATKMGLDTTTHHPPTTHNHHKSILLCRQEWESPERSIEVLREVGVGVEDGAGSAGLLLPRLNPGRRPSILELFSTTTTPPGSGNILI